MTAPHETKGGWVFRHQFPIRLLQESPEQARRVYPEFKMKALAESIRQYGQRNPIVAYRRDDGQYEIIDGHRRVRAIRSLYGDDATVAAWLYKGSLTPVEAVKLQRDIQDLNEPHSEYHKTRQLARVVEALGPNPEVIASMVNLSVREVADRLHLITLSPEVIEQAETSGIPWFYFRQAGRFLVTEELAKRVGMSRDELMVLMLNKFRAKSITSRSANHMKRAARMLARLPVAGARFWLTDPRQGLVSLEAMAGPEVGSIETVLRSFLRSVPSIKAVIVQLRQAEPNGKFPGTLFQQALDEARYIVREIELARERARPRAKKAGKAA